MASARRRQLPQNLPVSEDTIWNRFPLEKKERNAFWKGTGCSFGGWRCRGREVGPPCSGGQCFRSLLLRRLTDHPTAGYADDFSIYSPLLSCVLPILTNPGRPSNRGPDYEWGLAVITSHIKACWTWGLAGNHESGITEHICQLDIYAYLFT